MNTMGMVRLLTDFIASSTVPAKLEEEQENEARINVVNVYEWAEKTF